ncbi:hypothetical protein ESA94_16405 [Lacibacter luteus]|uniref:Uncharacterized protein n=1 Tax=Lacibacter luteus TaxID=2508719 RepID=A0A4Q1CGQ9_9BACT|nr:hypothetical protein [Lacibacter luteus]RXK58965.1 hypothetical protein ESA94_16405 [Lacibacter luteus]
MLRIVFFISTISFLFVSCDGYDDVTIKDAYISLLNDSLLKEHKKGSAWTHSPDQIARHFYPPVPNETNPKYTIDSKSNYNSVVTIDHGGPYDDEVLGERHILYLKLKDEHWTIVDIKHQIKRRL